MKKDVVVPEGEHEHWHVHANGTAHSHPHGHEHGREHAHAHPLGRPEEFGPPSPLRERRRDSG